MPTIQQTQNTLKREAAANLGNVLKQLGDLLNPARTESYNMLIVLESDFKRMNKTHIRGSASPEQRNREAAHLTDRLLAFIDSLEAEDFLGPRLMAYEIYERILVVTKSPERRAFLERFFPEEYFQQTSYDDSGEPQAAEGSEIVVYDDTPPPPQGEDDPLLRHYLENTGAVVLYFGRHSPLVWKFPEKAYATNSVFSLHARIREMAEYLRYRRAYEAREG